MTGHVAFAEVLTTRILFKVFLIEHLMATAQINLSSLNVRIDHVRLRLQDIPIGNDQGCIFLWSDGTNTILKLQDLRS